jgi:transposase
LEFLELLRLGETVPGIVDSLGISRNTVFKWMDIAEDNGVILLRPNGRRRPVVYKSKG